MRLFHVSEEPDIRCFVPRLPQRKDLDPNTGLVWAIDEERLPNFLTPRNCPRVGYRLNSHTTPADRGRFFASHGTTHALVLESRWFSVMQSTVLYLYEFNPEGFVLQDAVAGYYVSTETQYPIGKYELTDLFAELLKRKVEIRITDNLWDIADAVQASSLDWSLCRMAYAAPRP